MLPQDDQSPGVAQPGLPNECKGANWKECFESLSIDTVVKDDRAFKSRLGIGEDAYFSSRLLKIVDNALVTGAAAGAGGAVAAAPVVAGAFFPAGGILGLLGLGTAVTPVGWVIVGAAASGLGYGFIRKLARKIAGPVEVIPRYINSPIDLLAASLFDVMAPFALKVSHADGEYHDDEKRRIQEYFADSWGYNREYVDLGLEYAEVNLPGFETEDVARAFAGFCKENRDCNFPAIARDIEGFLQDLIEADGRRSEEEEHELERIREVFRQQAMAPVRTATDNVASSVRDGAERVAEGLAAAGEAAVEKGGNLVAGIAAGFAVASETLTDFARNLDWNSVDPTKFRYAGTRGIGRTPEEARLVWETIPVELRSLGTEAIGKHLDGYDWSHIVPHCKGGGNEAINGIFELANRNRGRGAELMTEAEVEAAAKVLKNTAFQAALGKVASQVLVGAAAAAAVSCVTSSLEYGLAWKRGKITENEMYCHIGREVAGAAGFGAAVSGVMAVVALMFPALIPLAAPLMMPMAILGFCAAGTKIVCHGIEWYELYHEDPCGQLSKALPAPEPISS